MPMEDANSKKTIGELAASFQPYLTGRYPGAIFSDFQFLTSGWESDVYSFTLCQPGEDPQGYILRLYPGEGSAEKMAREAAGLSRLHSAGYPVPLLLLNERNPGFLGMPFTVLEKLEGRNLWPVLAQASPAQANRMLDRFAGLIAQLHQLDWRPFIPNAAIYQAHPAGLLEELFASARGLYIRFDLPGFLTIIDWLETNSSGLKLKPAVVHLDLHANNVLLCADDRLVVIDWTQVTVSDYRVDLSWTLMIMGDLGVPAWGEHILRAYASTAGQPVDDLEYFQVISALKLLGSTVISLKADPKNLGLRPETAASIQGQAPIYRALARRIQITTGLVIPEIEKTITG
jgi:aminoglycoside phosphotransferase (APT) family kinase protein